MNSRLNVIVDGVKHVHPSQQALDYADFLASVRDAFSDGGTPLAPCSLCHNLSPTKRARKRRPDRSLVAWNRKRDPKRQFKPENDPYTLWATTAAWREDVGCIYSAQGFEFDRFGVVWRPDLVWHKITGSRSRNARSIIL
jgi:schlafen family protein